MSTTTAEEEIIKKSIELLSKLTSHYNNNGDDENGKVQDLDHALHRNLSYIRNSEEFEFLQSVRHEEISWHITEQKSMCRWNFVCTVLYLMQNIRENSQNSKNEKTKLISLSQKKILQTSLQFVISLGILQYLLPGIGISLEKRCEQFRHIPSENLNDFAKYKRLCFVVDNILSLRSGEIFYELIITKHLEDLLAALLQLSFVPYKKPVCKVLEDSKVLNLRSLDENFEITEMTYAVWRMLEENKKRYRNQLLKLQSEIYRPFLIRTYLILLGSKKSPRWMQKNISYTLKNFILEDCGVVSTIKGIVEVDNESLIQSSHYTTMAKLISSIFSELDEVNAECLALQLRTVLSEDKKQGYELAYIQITASAVAYMFGICSDRCKKYLLDEIFKPLITFESAEDNIDVCINQLSNMYLLPTNNSIAVPISTMLRITPTLFSIFVQIKESVCYLKSSIKQLLEKLMVESSEEVLSSLFDILIFNQQNEILRFPERKKVKLTGEGGIQFEKSETNGSELENGLVILQLFKNIESNEKLINSLFIYLLQKYLSCTDEESSVKKVVIIILLTELSEDESTLKNLLKNPENIIEFVEKLLQMHSDKCDENTDVIRVCLTFLTMVLYDLRKKKNIKWSTFTPMLSHIKKLFKSRFADVTLLANEVHNLISTRNLIGSISDEKESSRVLIEEIPKSACEKAIEEACDPLLPVRAHALMEIASMIKKADPETLSKKDRIICLFQENLKDKDSFLYLRAIEGLASMATLKPHDVLPSLCEEFTTCSTTETRLKVGEVLLRTVKLLNDFLWVHKRLLFNTFLTGTKDADSLVRASCLSNLGELCFLLKAGVEHELYEIVLCAQNIASNDKAVEPRRAAVFLIYSLFRGLKNLTLMVLQSCLLELYRILKSVHDVDEDEVVRVQAALSLDVLKENMTDFFTGNHKLEKRIYVLDPHH